MSVTAFDPSFNATASSSAPTQNSPSAAFDNLLVFPWSLPSTAPTKIVRAASTNRDKADAKPSSATPSKFKTPAHTPLPARREASRPAEVDLDSNDLMNLDAPAGQQPSGTGGKAAPPTQAAPTAGEPAPTTASPFEPLPKERPSLLDGLLPSDTLWPELDNSKPTNTGGGLPKSTGADQSFVDTTEVRKLKPVDKSGVYWLGLDDALEPEIKQYNDLIKADPAIEVWGTSDGKDGNGMPEWDRIKDAYVQPEDIKNGVLRFKYDDRAKGTKYFIITRHMLGGDSDKAADARFNALVDRVTGWYNFAKVTGELGPAIGEVAVDGKNKTLKNHNASTDGGDDPAKYIKASPDGLSEEDQENGEYNQERYHYLTSGVKHKDNIQMRHLDANSVKNLKGGAWAYQIREDAPKAGEGHLKFAVREDMPDFTYENDIHGPYDVPDNQHFGYTARNVKALWKAGHPLGDEAAETKDSKTKKTNLAVRNYINELQENSNRKKPDDVIKKADFWLYRDPGKSSKDGPEDLDSRDDQMGDNIRLPDNLVQQLKEKKQNGDTGVRITMVNDPYVNNSDYKITDAPDFHGMFLLEGFSGKENLIISEAVSPALFKALKEAYENGEIGPRPDMKVIQAGADAQAKEALDKYGYHLNSKQDTYYKIPIR